MNRRGFLRNLAIGIAAVHLRINPLVDRPPVAMPMLQAVWHCTTRTIHLRSTEYTVALNRIIK
jgi:hypothetical protein